MTQHSAVNEENAKADQEEFDVAEVLPKGREKQDQAGIKHKAVGVSWEDLEVVGAGGLKINIRNFSSAIIDQVMMPPVACLGLIGFNPFATKPRTILQEFGPAQAREDVPRPRQAQCRVQQFPQVDRQPARRIP